MEQVFKGIPVVPSLGPFGPRSLDPSILDPCLTSLHPFQGTMTSGARFLDVSRQPPDRLITLQAAQHHDSRAKQHHQRVLRHLARVHPLFAVPGLPTRRVLRVRGYPRPSRRHQSEHAVLVRLQQGSVMPPQYSGREEDGALISGVSQQRWEGVYYAMKTILGMWSLTG